MLAYAPAAAAPAAMAAAAAGHMCSLERSWCNPVRVENFGFVFYDTCCTAHTMLAANLLRQLPLQVQASRVYQLQLLGLAPGHMRIVAYW
jgi:hypothetical protein